MREKMLFCTGIVAAYFTLSELEGLQGPASVGIALGVSPGADGSVGGGGGKKIKTAASRRDIPLHPKLIESGFLRWVKTLSPGWLFENCRKERDGSIRCISKFVSSQLDQVGVDSQLSLHGSRRTFRTLARDVQPSIPKEIIDAIVGHAPDTQGGRVRRRVAAYEVQNDLPD